MDPNCVSSDDFNPEDDFVCPYFPEHNKVQGKQLPYHLMKCRKMYTKGDTTSCPFNARHVVKTPEFKYHTENCPDRKHIQRDIAYQQRIQGIDVGGLAHKGCTDLPQYNRVPSPTENWDNEGTDESSGYRIQYNPSNYPGPAPVQNLTGFQNGRDSIDSSNQTSAKRMPSTNLHYPKAERAGGSQQPKTTASSPIQGPIQDLPVSKKEAVGLRLPRHPGRASQTTRGGVGIAANIFAAVDNKPDSLISIAADLQKTNESTPRTQTQGGNIPVFQPSVVGIGRGLSTGYRSNIYSS